MDPELAGGGGSDPLSVLSLGVTAFGKLSSGFANSSLAQIQASVADANTKLLLQKAQVDRDSADLSLSRGMLETGRAVASINRAVGGEIAGDAAGNLDPTTGSPLLLEGFSRAQGQTDLALIGARVQMGVAAAYGRSAGDLAEAATSNWQAIQARMKADQALMAGYFGAGTALLKGGGALIGGLAGLFGAGAFGGEAAAAGGGLSFLSSGAEAVGGLAVVA